MAEKPKKQDAQSPKKGRTGRAVKGRVTRTDKDNVSGAVSRDEYRDMPVDDAWFDSSKPTANVGFSMGHTINKGDYESVRIECSLHIPCYTHEVVKVQPLVRGTVEDWLGTAVLNAKKEMGLLGDIGVDNATPSPDGPSESKPSKTGPEAQESKDSATPPWEGGSGDEEPAVKEPEVSTGDPENERKGDVGDDFDLMRELGIDV